MSHVQLLTNVARVEAGRYQPRRRRGERKHSRRLELAVSRLSRNPAPARAAHA